MTDNFKPGDVVMLKSGGQQMTYERLAQEGYGICIWFEGSTNKQGNFPHVALKKVDDDPKRHTGGAFVV